MMAKEAQVEIYPVMSGKEAQVKIYPYRWVVLFVFCVYSSINSLQYLQYSIISDIIMKYYQVNSFMVDLTGIVFMLAFILFCLPANCLINHYDLRIVVILSSILTSLGNLVKLLSADNDRFYVVIIGQTLCAIAQTFVLTIPSKLASTWFGSDQVSSACALALLGTASGVAIGCFLPPYFIQNSNNLQEIGDSLYVMLIYNATATCLSSILVILFFRAKPELPPSLSQIELEKQDNSVLVSVKKILKNKNFLLVLLAFSISNAIWNSFGLLINTIYLQYFPNSEKDVGLISFIALLFGGCLGCVIFGYILDKTHKFRAISFIVFAASAISIILVTFTLIAQIKLATYFTIPIFAFFIASSLVIGVEFATEITYPSPGNISCGIFYVTMYTFGIIFTLTIETLLGAFGVAWSTLVIAIFLLFCSILCFFIKPTLYRHEANLQNQ